MPVGVEAQLLEILACPCPEHAPLVEHAADRDEAEGYLACTSCGRRFPIRDGIPVLLLEEALGGPGTEAAEGGPRPSGGADEAVSDEGVPGNG